MEGPAVTVDKMKRFDTETEKNLNSYLPSRLITGRKGILRIQIKTRVILIMGRSAETYKQGGPLQC